MAQTYTLEEAAEHLNLSVEELKRRLRTEWTQVRSFRDGSTLRFRANEIDELARSIGLGSSEELPLADAGGAELPDEIGLAKDQGTPKTPPPAKKPRTDVDAPLQLGDSDEVFHLTADSGQHPKPRGDSDVRLEKADKKTQAADGEESILTEELEPPAAGGSGKLSGKSGKLSSAKLKQESGKVKSGDSSGKAKSGDSSGKKVPSQPAEEDSSEFELSLDADSDEFELSLAQDSSEEVPLGNMPPEPANKTGKSGINISRPADSGVSLEKRKKAEDDEVDFELSLDAPGSGKSSTKFGSGSGAKKGSQPDSDSEFELTLEEPSDMGAGSGETPAAAAAGEKKGDIFEATDFEIPALEDDSASEVVSLEESDTDLESSDFDLALDEADASAEGESGSEVVALEEGKGKKGRRKKKAEDDDEAVDFDSDLEEGPSASKALRGVRAGEDEEEEEYEVGEAAEDEEGRPVAVAAPAQWGIWPGILMMPTILFVFLGGLMAYELLHSAWGYQQGATPATPLVSFFADTAGMKPAQ